MLHTQALTDAEKTVLQARRFADKQKQYYLGKLGNGNVKEAERLAARDVVAQFPFVTRPDRFVRIWSLVPDANFNYYHAPSPGRPRDVDRIGSEVLNGCVSAVLAHADLGSPLEWTPTCIGGVPHVNRVLRSLHRACRAAGKAPWPNTAQLMRMMLQAETDMVIETGKLKGYFTELQKDKRLSAAEELLSMFTGSSAAAAAMNRVFMLDETHMLESALKKEPPRKIAVRSSQRGAFVQEARYTAAGDRLSGRKYTWLAVVNPLTGGVVMVWQPPTPGITVSAECLHSFHTNRKACPCLQACALAAPVRTTARNCPLASTAPPKNLCAKGPDQSMHRLPCQTCAASHPHGMRYACRMAAALPHPQSAHAWPCTACARTHAIR